MTVGAEGRLTVRSALEQMLSLFGDRLPSEVLFTTFTFSPRFFEGNVLPLCCGYKANELKGYAVSRQTLNQTLEGLQIAVFCDRSTQPEHKDRLRYGLLPVGLSAGRFHAKVILVHGRDSEDVEHLAVSVSSANLSFSGWCLNREVVGWAKASPQHAPELVRLLDWLRERADEAFGEGTREDCALRHTLEALREGTVRAALEEPDRRRNCSVLVSVPQGGDSHPSLADRVSDGRRWEDVTVYSPYWQGVREIAAAFGAPKMTLVPTVDSAGQHSFPKGSLCGAGGGQGTSIALRKRWETDRFTHAKAYVLAGGGQTRLCIGSANCTGPALLSGGWLRNVEAMLAYDNVETGPFADSLVPLSLEDIVDPEFVQTDEPGPPPLPPFEVIVVFDWDMSTFTCRYRVAPHRHPEHVRIYIGGPLERALDKDHWEAPLSIQTEARRWVGSFTVCYTEGGEEMSYRGHILQVNGSDLDLGYVARPVLDRLIDELRSLGTWDKAELARRNQSEEHLVFSPEGDMEDGELEDFDFFAMYQAFHNLRAHLAENPTLNCFSQYGVHSLQRILNAVTLESSQTPRARIRRYMVLLELQRLAASRPRSDERTAFLQALEGDISELRRDIQELLVSSTSLHAALKSQRYSRGAARAFERWFLKEAGKDG